MPADCLFFDQIGARPWRHDFNPAASSPLAYYDGWLSLFAPYADRCLMVEDGWDRLAASFSGFDSSLMLMAARVRRGRPAASGRNWTPFRSRSGCSTTRCCSTSTTCSRRRSRPTPEILTWNLAFGFMLSYDWAGRASESPWLGIATAFQRALGPHFAGQR